MFNPDPKPRYHGITYKPMTDAALRKWKARNCPKGIHAFDEVLSDEHYLSCDACGLCVHIAGIETEKQALERLKEKKAGGPKAPVLEKAGDSKRLKKIVRKYLADNGYPGYAKKARS